MQFTDVHQPKIFGAGEQPCFVKTALRGLVYAFIAQVQLEAYWLGASRTRFYSPTRSDLNSIHEVLPC